MVSTVQCPKASWIVSWIKWSVSTSTDAVASSKSRILFLRSRARAKQMSCFSPTDRFSPSTSTGQSSCFSSRLICHKSPHIHPTYYDRTATGRKTTVCIVRYIFTHIPEQLPTCILHYNVPLFATVLQLEVLTGGGGGKVRRSPK